MHLLKSVGLMDVIPEELYQSSFRVLSLNAREPLFLKNEVVRYVYIVISGSLTLEALPREGASAIAYSFATAGSLLGIFSYLEPGHHHNASAIAMESSVVLAFPLANFLLAIDHQPKLRAEVHRQLAANFKELQRDRELQNAPTSVRLAKLILTLNRAHLHRTGDTFSFKVTKKDLAKKIGSQPETVIRLLAEWGRMGIVKSKERWLEICQPEQLKRLAFEGPTSANSL